MVENGKLYNYVGDKKADQRVDSLLYELPFGNYCRYANFIISTKPLQGESEVTLGDINADGLVNLSDAIALLNKVTAQEAIDLTVGDINGDGTVNLQDAIALLNLVTQGEN